MPYMPAILRACLAGSLAVIFCSACGPGAPPEVASVTGVSEYRLNGNLVRPRPGNRLLLVDVILPDAENYEEVRVFFSSQAETPMDSYDWYHLDEGGSSEARPMTPDWQNIEWHEPGSEKAISRYYRIILETEAGERQGFIQFMDYAPAKVSFPVADNKE